MAKHRWLFAGIIGLVVATMVGPIVEARQDPLRVMLTQRTKPAVMIVMDTSGSMAFPPIARSRSCFFRRVVDCFGVSGRKWYFYRWGFRLNAIGISGYGLVAADFTVPVGDRGYGHGYWMLVAERGARSYWYFVPPSRMAIMKNVLGNSIRFYRPTVEPTGCDDSGYHSPPCRSGKPYYVFPRGGGPRGGAYYDYPRRRWRNWLRQQSEPIPDPAYTEVVEPLDILGTTADLLYWGLVTYGAGRAHQQVPIVTDDTVQQAQLNQLHIKMRPVQRGGLNPYGGTNTSGGMNEAKRSMKITLQSRDRKLGHCRSYYTILVTDGESNLCNPGDDEWGAGCPNNQWRRFPPGRSDELFLQRPDTASQCRSRHVVPKPVQTFVIGVSPDVSRCELNLVAYMGRTDASSEEAGVNWKGNSRLPQNVSGFTSLSNFDPANGDYAFFANTAEQIRDAFLRIVSAVLAGDYSTSQALGVQVTAVRGAVLIPSTRIPGWMGSLRHWSLVDPDDGANHVDPVASTLCEDLKDPNKIISAGDPNDKHFHLVWDAGCSLNDQIDPTQPDYNRRIYTVAPTCTTADPVRGPSSGCTELTRLQKDTLTVSWIRANITTVDWSTVDLDGDGDPASRDDDDILMLIDFILGGDGEGNPRAWVIGDIVGSRPVVVGKPLTYTLTENIPPKEAFNLTYIGRERIVYITANDGLLHAFRMNHNPRTPSSPSIEVFAFMPPQVFPKVLKLFKNYRDKPSIPTGQKEEPVFDKHVWTMAAPLSFADVWIRWEKGGQGDWRTVLYMPMGPTMPGAYAIDVTDPAADPPLRVIWYWEDTRPDPDLGKEVWGAMPIGITRAGGSAKGFYEQWVVGVNTTNSLDEDVDSLLVLLNADTGETVYERRLTKPSGTLRVSYHTYGNMAFMSVEVPVYRPDALLTHTFSADTAGRIIVQWLAQDTLNPQSDWRPNNPEVPLDFGPDNPIYFTPAVAHAAGTRALLLATATGSIFEDDPDINSTQSNFRSKSMLDLLDVDPGTLDIRQTRPGDQHEEFVMEGSFPLDVDGDGKADGDVVLSDLTRASGRPQITMDEGGTSGRAFFLIFDPMVFNPEVGKCVGQSYLFPVAFELDTSSGSSVGFKTVATKPLQSLGYGVVTGIVAGVERIVVAITGFGQESIVLPIITPYENPTAPVTVPRLRSVKQIQ